MLCVEGKIARKENFCHTQFSLRHRLWSAVRSLAELNMMNFSYTRNSFALLRECEKKLIAIIDHLRPHE